MTTIRRAIAAVVGTVVEALAAVAVVAALRLPAASHDCVIGGAGFAMPTLWTRTRSQARS